MNGRHGFTLVELFVVLVILGILSSVGLFKYIDLKQKSADRCPKELGSSIKKEEIMFHHEVTNQWLWNQF